MSEYSKESPGRKINYANPRTGETEVADEAIAHDNTELSVNML